MKEFNYKPQINLNQFFSQNFLEKKIEFVTETIKVIMKSDLVEKKVKNKNYQVSLINE
jgi:hypothetical protein